MVRLRQEHPEVQQVIWFGSWVTGLPGPGSDVDLCLVVTHSEQPYRVRHVDYLPVGFPVGIDLFVYTEDEFARLPQASPGWYTAIQSGVRISGMPQVMNTAPAVLDAVDRLVRGLQPDRIYLFGSQATGQATESSDIDLLVVVPASTLPRHRREAASYDLLWGIPVPIDVIVLTRDEFERGRRVKTSLASVVEAEGKVVYG